MARNHGRIFTSIWNDPDFLDLESGPQRVFMLLLSQQNLSHAGLLPLTVTRWANKAKDTSVDRFENHLADLVDRRYVVIDRDTQELLVRSLMRRDEVWKHWKVMTAAGRDVEAIASPILRCVVAEEVARMLAIAELPDLSRKVLESLRDALPNPTDCQPVANPGDKGWGYTEVSNYLPQPLPTAPSPAPAAFADDPTGQLLAEHVNAYTEPPPISAQAKVKVEIMRLVAEGVPAPRISAGLARLREKRIAVSLLPQLVAECATVTRSSTTDQRVAAGLALVDKYREAEGA